MSTQIVIEESPFSRFIFGNTKMAWFWFLVRAYLGFEWINAGIGKLQNPAWFGGEAGAAISGFVKGALSKTSGAHPDVSFWYASFLENVVLPNAKIWANAIAAGEFLVGLGLILGALTGIAAFFGLFMNLNFLLAGTVSTNPIMFTLAIGTMLAWRIAGYYGLDRFLLPLLGTPWRPGNLFRKSYPQGS